MRTLLQTLLIPLLLLPLCLGAGSAGAAEQLPLLALTAQQAKALGIDSEALGSAGSGLAAGLPAEVRVPNEQLRVIAAPMPGMVVAIDVAAGQSVKKGQVLARLASPALLGAERDFLQAAQSAQLAAQAARRDEQLFAEGIIAESRLQTTRVGDEQAQVGLAARREELRLAGVSENALSTLAQQRRLPSEVLIAAPIAGVILEQSVQPGQRVDAAAPLFRIGQLTPLWIEIQAPAALAADLREGLAVSVPAVGAAGHVINVGRQIGASSQTLSVRARIDSGSEKLSPGQMVEASIDVPASGQGFRVVQSALVRVGGEAHVFVVDSEGRGFRPLAVRVVGQAGDKALLQAPGLTPQTRIAIKGVASLKSTWTALPQGEAVGNATEAAAAKGVAPAAQTTPAATGKAGGAK
jgi:RND family efflux transporter MFP subunit